MTSKVASKPAQRPKNKLKLIQNQENGNSSNLQSESSTRARIRHAAATSSSTRPDAGVKPKTLWNSWMSESVRQTDRENWLVGSFKSAWRQHWQESEREPSTEKIRDSGNIVQVSLLFQMQDLDDQLTDHVDNCKQWTSKLNGQRGENERVEALSFLRPRKCWKHSTKCFYPFRILFSNDFRF